MSAVPTPLFSEEEIGTRVAELGRQITDDYADREPVLVAILRGSVLFLADLMRQIDLPLRVDFMSISKYAAPEGASGVVRILKDLDQDIGGSHVLIVEDIIDTGLTLSYLLSSLWERRPASIELCTLLDRSVRGSTLDIRYRGFDCPDHFVVGYGLDHEERYRNLPFIMALPRQPDEEAAMLDQLFAGWPFEPAPPPIPS